MNTHHDQKNSKLIAELQREAGKELPEFSTELHERIMRAAARATTKMVPHSGELVRQPRFFFAAVSLRIAAVVVIIATAGGLIVRNYFPHSDGPITRSTTPAINISSLIPDPVAIIEKTTMLCQQQYANAQLDVFITQTRQIEHYIIQQATLSDLVG